MKNNFVIPNACPSFGKEEEEAVLDVIRSGWISQGQWVEKFEKTFSGYLGIDHCVFVTNGTAALHLALAAVGVGPGDEVIIPSFSFVSTANAVLFLGGKPVFADIDRRTFNITAAHIERHVTEKTKAVIPVHYAGIPVDMDPILELAEIFRFSVIEDAAEAHGARYKGRMCGTLGHIGCFSFFSNKIISTGEGGMVTTRHACIAEKIRALKNYGRINDGQVALGFNYKPTEFQGALGCAQMKKIDWALKRRAEITARYKSHLGAWGFTFQKTDEKDHPCHTFFPALHERRDHLVKWLRQAGIETKVYFQPIHKQPYYRKIGSLSIRLDNTDAVSSRIVNLPLFPDMKKADFDTIIDTIQMALKMDRGLLIHEISGIE